MSVTPFRKPPKHTIGTAVADLLRDADTMSQSEFGARVAALGLTDLELTRAAEAFRLSGRAKEMEADALAILAKLTRALPALGGDAA